MRGHAERREDRDQWTDAEWGNHAADAVAEGMYQECEEEIDIATRCYSGERNLWDADTPASDKLYDMALKRIAENHISNYMQRHSREEMM